MQIIIKFQPIPKETGIIIMCHGLPGERHEEGRFPKMSELCNAVWF